MRFNYSARLIFALLLATQALATIWLLTRSGKGKAEVIPRSREGLLERLDRFCPFEMRLVGINSINLHVEPRRLSAATLRNALDFIDKDKTSSKAERLANTSLIYALGSELDKAIQLQSQATVSKGEMPWMWSDLAAFYLERFQRDRDSIDLLRALDSSSRAHVDLSGPIEANFNYALSLGKLSAFTLAQGAWRQYISRDPNSAWSRNAQLHLQEAQQCDAIAQWATLKKNLARSTTIPGDPRRPCHCPVAFTVFTRIRPRRPPWRLGYSLGEGPERSSAEGSISSSEAWSSPWHRIC